jgi:serine/threonine protein kinase
MKKDNCTLNLELGFDGIKSGVRHLHSLELAHNDISLSNIMVNGDTWILIDAGSCRPIGESLIMAGSASWTTSSKQNDEVALDRLRTFLNLGSSKLVRPVLINSCNACEFVEPFFAGLAADAEQVETPQSISKTWTCLVVLPLPSSLKTYELLRLHLLAISASSEM